MRNLASSSSCADVKALLILSSAKLVALVTDALICNISDSCLVLSMPSSFVIEAFRFSIDVFQPTLSSTICCAIALSSCSFHTSTSARRALNLSLNSPCIFATVSRCFRDNSFSTARISLFNCTAAVAFCFATAIAHFLVSASISNSACCRLSCTAAMHSALVDAMTLSYSR